jgi:hypothetical protein
MEAQKAWSITQQKYRQMARQLPDDQAGRIFALARNLNGRHTRRRKTNKAASVGGLFHIDPARGLPRAAPQRLFGSETGLLLIRGELRRLAATIHRLKLVYVFLGLL